jgi:fibronectin type 3 domain-containing protein
LGNGAFVRIAETQDLATYSDRKIEAGKTYRYTVTAVKKNGRESERPAPVEAATP